MAIKDYFQEIADAIRAKGGTSALITPGNMPQAIADLPTGGSNDLLNFIKYCAPTYQGGYEYKGYIYGNSQLIEDCGLELIYDASQGGESTLTVSDISVYKNLVLQGVYQKNRTSTYNTTLCYPDFILNQQYWAGMKDRNTTYTCYVTITSNTSITLGGNLQVLIYGMR